MPSFVYNPGPDDPEVIRTHNRTFKAGESFDVDEKDPLFAKYQGHPQFQGEEAGNKVAETNRQQAELNASVRRELTEKRRETTDARTKAREALAKAEADERNIGLSERALGTLSPAEQRAMDQVSGGPQTDEDGNEIGTGDGISGGGVVGNTGTGSQLEPDNRAKAEGRAQR